jgi:hypothetical protein
MEKFKCFVGTFIGILLISWFIFQGCATIMHGTTQDVGFGSSPSGAKVTIDGQEKGKTPVIVDLRRKDNHQVRIELDGYQPYETSIVRKVSGWVLGNILFGGLIGLAVDAISGGLYNLTPEQVQATLAKADMSHLYRNDTLYIVTVLTPDPTWQKVGNLTKAQ